MAAMIDLLAARHSNDLFVPKGKTEDEKFPGYRSHKRIASPKMLGMAKSKLKEHPTFGDKALENEQGDSSQPAADPDASYPG